MACTLLVAREHVAHGRPARHRVVGRQDRAARDAERDVDAFRLERAEHRVGAEHRSRHRHTSSKCSTSVRACGSSAITASVNDCVSRVPPLRRAAAATTARSSVRDAARRFSPSASISDVASSIAFGIGDAEAGVLVGLARRRREHARPVVGQPAVGDGRARAGERRGGIDDGVDEVRLGDDHVERLRPVAQPRRASRRAGPPRRVRPSQLPLARRPAPPARRRRSRRR